MIHNDQKTSKHQKAIHQANLGKMLKLEEIRKILNDKR